MQRVLYIAGWGRSGTTLLDNLLGQCEGVVSGGELHHLWQRGLVDGRDCGCGEKLVECEFWRAVFASQFGGLESVDATAAIRAQDSIHTRHIFRILRAARRGGTLGRVAYADHQHRLYRGILEVSGATTVVDSSKFPTDAVVAVGLGDLEVHVVHVVRDPRAVAFSWSRRKVAQDKVRDDGLLRQVGWVRSTAVWQVYNLLIASVVRYAVGKDRYLRVGDEDLAQRPAQVLADILDLLGQQSASRPDIPGGVVDLQPTHTAGGNPDRFRSGATTIRPDTAWRSSMPRGRRWGVSLLAMPTWPLLRRRARS